jgi:hypothetical protein
MEKMFWYTKTINFLVKCLEKYHGASTRKWAHHASEMLRDFSCFEVVEWILRGWRFGASKSWRCPSANLVVVSIPLFFAF